MAYNKHTWQSQEIISASKLNNIEDGVKQVDDLGALMAAYAVNMSNLEGEMQDLTDGPVAAAVADADAAESAALSVEQSFAELETILDSIGLTRGSRINRPNLLKQNYFCRYDAPITEVVPIEITIPAETAGEIGTPLTFTYQDARITAQSTLYGVELVDDDNIDTDDLTCTCAAGSAQITVPARKAAHNGITFSVEVCEHAIQTIIYGQTSKCAGYGSPYLKNIYHSIPSQSGVDPDAVSVQLVELTGGDVITEGDEEVYNTALSFTVSAASTAYGNVEELQYKYGSYGAGTFTDTAPKEYGNITELQVGETYTMSCWARVTNGEKALIRMAYDPVKRGNDANCREWIEVSSTTWERIHWTFTFNQTGNQFTDTETTKEVDGETVAATARTVNWTKTIGFGVSRKYAGTVQLCGFRLVEGGLYLPTKYDELEQRIAALEAQLEEAQTAISNLEGIVTENGGNES